MESIKRPKRITLHKALKLGYLRNERKQRKRLKRYGYVLDPTLTTGEHMVAYNPTLNKVLYVSNGSETNLIRNPAQFVEDWKNNIVAIPTGTFQNTQRFRDEKSTFLKAKDKYKEAKIVLVGHSQSAQTVNLLADKNAKGYTLDPALLKQKENPNVRNYRVHGDLVSSLANHTTTLPNPKHLGSGNIISEPHDIENIRNQPIFI